MYKIPTPLADKIILDFSNIFIIFTGVHVWHGEVHRSLSDGGDGHVNNGHVSLLCSQFFDHSGPLAILETSIFTFRFQMKLKLELEIFGQSLKKEIR